MSQVNRITRIVIMADNQVGAIAAIAAILADAGVNLESINTQENNRQGAVIVTTDNSDRALYALNQAGYKAVGDEVLVLQVPDRPGALAGVAQRLKDARVNIQSMHILNRHDGRAMIALTTDDQDRAQEAVGQEDIV